MERDKAAQQLQALAEQVGGAAAAPAPTAAPVKSSSGLARKLSFGRKDKAKPAAEQPAAPVDNGAAEAAGETDVPLKRKVGAAPRRSLRAMSHFPTSHRLPFPVTLNPRATARAIPPPTRYLLRTLPRSHAPLGFAGILQQGQLAHACP